MISIGNRSSEGTEASSVKEVTHLAQGIKGGVFKYLLKGKQGREETDIFQIKSLKTSNIFTNILQITMTYHIRTLIKIDIQRKQVPRVFNEINPTV